MRRAALLIPCALGLASLGVFRRRLLLVRVVGHSMEPAYADGDTLLAVRVARSRGWRAGEDLVFTPTGRTRVPGDPPYLVKRVRAVPGDPVPPEVVTSDLVPGDQIARLMDAAAGLIKPDWLLVQGLNLAAGPSWYAVQVSSVIGRVVTGPRAAFGPRPHQAS